MAAKPKLAAPMNVVPAVSADELTVTWDPVPGVGGYQVEVTGILDDGTIEHESDFVENGPHTMEVGGYAALMVHVRAVPVPKVGKRLGSGGPKGLWSDPKAVEMPPEAPVTP